MYLPFRISSANSQLELTSRNYVVTKSVDEAVKFLSSTMKHLHPYINTLIICMPETKCRKKKKAAGIVKPSVWEFFARIEVVTLNFVVVITVVGLPWYLHCSHLGPIS